MVQSTHTTSPGDQCKGRLVAILFFLGPPRGAALMGPHRGALKGARDLGKGPRGLLKGLETCPGVAMLLIAEQNF